MGFSPCGPAKALICALILPLLLTCTAFAAAFDKADIDKKLADLAAYKQGGPRKTLITFEQLVARSQSNPEQRIYIEKALARLLLSDASPQCKEFACTQLSYIGSAESVPAIATLLTDEKTVDIACMAIGQNPSPEAAAALREALDKTAPPIRIRIIDLLGERKDAESAQKIAQLALGPDKQTAQTAIAALGRIGGPIAIETLAKARQHADEDFRSAATEAYLQCAEDLAENDKPAEALEIYKQLAAKDEQPFTRTAAIRGVAAIGGPEAVKIVIAAFKDTNRMVRTTALGCVRIVPGNDAASLFAAQLPKSSPAEQIMLLAALGDRGDTAALDEIKRTAKSPDPNVRRAALNAIARIGGAHEVAFLADAASAAEADERKAVIAAIAILRGDGVDKAIVANMKKAQMPLRAELIGVLADRNAADAVPPLLKEAASEDTKIRRAACKALGDLARPTDLPALLSLIVDTEGRTPSRDAERAVIAAARRIPDPNQQAHAVIRKLAETKPVEVRTSLLRVLGGIANKKALETVRLALNDKDPKLQDTAVRTLATWPNSAAAPTLLEIYRDSKSPVHRILALRGLVRLLADGKYPAAKALDLLRQADKLTKDVSEKKLVLSGLSNIHDSKALDMAMTALEDQSVRAEAELAAIKIAKAVAPKNPDKAKAAANKLLAKTKSKTVQNQAKELIASIEKDSP